MTGRRITTIVIAVHLVVVVAAWGIYRIADTPRQPNEAIQVSLRTLDTPAPDITEPGPVPPVQAPLQNGCHRFPNHQQSLVRCPPRNLPRRLITRPKKSDSVQALMNGRCPAPHCRQPSRSSTPMRCTDSFSKISPSPMLNLRIAKPSPSRSASNTSAVSEPNSTKPGTSRTGQWSAISRSESPSR